MSESKNEKITQRLQVDYDLLESMGYEVVGVFLQGSQNYRLETDESDIDTKAIVLPTFDDFVLNGQAVSTTHILPSGEHIDIKDIRVMFETMKKCNINFTEILFTKYRRINEKYADLLAPLFDNANNIAVWNKKLLYNSISGMAMEKLKALKHPYPIIVHKIKRFGYDPKQLHHILRLEEFIVRLVGGESFENCLISKDCENLIAIKKGSLDLPTAEKMAHEFCEKIKNVRNLALEKGIDELQDVVQIYDSVKVDILKKWFREQLIR